MDSIRIEVKTLIVALSAILAVEVSAHAFSKDFALAPVPLTGIIRLIEIAIMALIIGTMGNGAAAMGLHPSGVVAGLKRGVAWSFGFGMMAGVAGLVLAIFGVDPMDWFRAPPSIHGADILWLFLVGGIISPVAEELFFRGILYGFCRRWGIIPAVMLSTLIFFLFHAFSGLAPQQVVGGILFAAAYEMEGNIVVPITVHMAGNISIFSLSFMG